MSKAQIPWFTPEFGLAEKKLVAQVIKSNYLNDGETSRLFEKRIAQYIGVKYCLAVTSGTAAITLALMGLGVGPGDEVIVPDLTFIATANAARLAGASVKLADIEDRRFTLETSCLEKLITRRTKAIIPVDVNGRGADYAFLEKIARKHKLFLVCDATEGLGSKWNGRYLGTLGDAGCFSFSPNKTISTGQGGLIATNNSKLYYRLRELKDQGRRFQGTGGDDLHPVLGYNFKFTNLQAAVGLAQLGRLRQRLAKAKERDRWYRDLLQGCPQIIFPEQKKDEIMQWTDVLIAERKKVIAAFKRAGIGFRLFWHPLHRQAPYAAKDRQYPNSIFVSQNGLWLPSGFGLTFNQARYVATTILKALSR